MFLSVFILPNAFGDIALGLRQVLSVVVVENRLLLLDTILVRQQGLSSTFGAAPAKRRIERGTGNDYVHDYDGNSADRDAVQDPARVQDRGY